MGRTVFETIMGALVLAVALGFVWIAYSSGAVDKGAKGGYKIHAKFDRADGLVLGSDVRLSGIKIGAVSGQEIDPKTYLAVVSMNLDPAIKIPTDSSAEIVGDGLLGGKYLAIVPGGAEELLPDGGEIKITQSSISLEQLIGKFVFGGSDGGEQPEDFEDIPSPSSSVPGSHGKEVTTYDENDVFGGI